MSNVKDYLTSNKRTPIPSPDSLVKNSKAIFGTFKEPIANINLLDCESPVFRYLPSSFNKFKLTVWEVVEIHSDEYIFLTAVYNVGFVGFNIFIFFEKETNKIYSWFDIVPGGKKAKVAENLIKSSTSQLKTKSSNLIFVNNLEDGDLKCSGHASNQKSGFINFDYTMENISEPSIVSIPFGKNRPLYTQKNIMSTDGYININGKRFNTNDATVSILDDHKGYYPFKMHYDWLSTMGDLKVGKNIKKVGFNLTRNQSINQEDYNENLIWVDETSSPLPPIEFERNGMIWRVKDEHGFVDLEYQVLNTFSLKNSIGIFKMDYHLSFGLLNGYIKDANGEKYEYENYYCMGEDKSTVF